MASNFPGAIDSFTNPLASSPLNSPSHAAQHQDVNDAVNKIETYMGLVKIADTSFSGATTPFINGCFSSLYENYRVVMNLNTSASTNIRLRFRYATSTTETASQYDRYGFIVSAGTLTNSTSLGETSYYFVSTTAGSTEIASVSMDIFGANAIKKTVVQSQTWNTNTGGLMFLNCRMNNMTQYTGFEINPDLPTISGTMTVYGYRK